MRQNCLSPVTPVINVTCRQSNRSPTGSQQIQTEAAVACSHLVGLSWEGGGGVRGASEAWCWDRAARSRRSRRGKTQAALTVTNLPAEDQDGTGIGSVSAPVFMVVTAALGRGPWVMATEKWSRSRAGGSGPACRPPCSSPDPSHAKCVHLSKINRISWTLVGAG